MTKARLWQCLLATGTALALVACGGDDAPAAGPAADPLQPYRSQTLAWGPCDPSILGRDDPSTQKFWQQLGSRLQCADARVPMDWSQPARGDLSVSVLRVAAAQPSKRRGALFFNPGGPGEDGLFMAFRLHHAFSKSLPENPQGALQLRLLDEYDMVGFSPRGVGASTRFACATNELERSVDLGPAGHAQPGYWDDLQYNHRKVSEACLKNPLAPHIHTDATARDLDLLRGLLGDEKLNYVGYSYGTWLGSWYASLFPERVGRMLLDSSTDFTSPFEQIYVLQPVARQRLLDELLAPYAARHAQAFNLGATAEQVRALPGTFLPQVQSVLANGISGRLYKHTGADDALNGITAAQGLDAVLRAQPPDVPTEVVYAALEAHDFNPTDAEQGLKARSIARGMFAEMTRPAMPQSIRLEGDAAVRTAVRCNDSPTIVDLAYWKAMSDRYAQHYPLFANSIDHMSCLYWGGPRVTRPPLSAMAGLDVLMLQSQYDAATATEGAMRSFEALPAARLIQVPGEFQHALYPYDDECLDTATTRYLLGESPASRVTTCPAHPLARDVPPTRTAQGYSRKSTPGVYRDPEAARELIEQYKRAIWRGPENMR